ncbi:E3 ubiquitin-protein ligase AMFR [Smittium mucronatum]|uniref:E3 ubiquitin-protein ligase AMFR n=1 Tax=Smittium mucronatum TaxID=133383 RepID=A0A1R0GXZ4_9FUNG|nr:E3 ubiquitin-protein ligase AMFR [Smittium mucronatum]
MYFFWNFCRAFFILFLIEGIITNLDVLSIVIQWIAVSAEDGPQEFVDGWKDRAFYFQSALDISFINGFNLNISGIMIFSNIQNLVLNTSFVIKRLVTYRRSLSEMNSVVVNATKVELKEHDDDVCPICWESMKQGIKLPCKHLFHKGCFRKWVEKHAICPICRLAIKDCEDFNKIVIELNETKIYGADLLYSQASFGMADPRSQFSLINNGNFNDH